jgi:hypothetical protein
MLAAISSTRFRPSSIMAAYNVRLYFATEITLTYSRGGRYFMIEFRLDVLRRRLREELAASRVDRLPGIGANTVRMRERPKTCEAAKQIHGAHAVALRSLMRSAASHATGA